MSHTSINIIYILGSMEILKLVEKKIGTSTNSLIGSKVSKKWKNAHIENLIFEEYQDISDFSTKYNIPIFKYKEVSKNHSYPSCYVFKFYSSSFGEGLGEYFEDLSKEFNSLQFIITWLIPDLGWVGREHQISGGIEDQEVVERDKSKSNFRKFIKYSNQWFEYEFDADYIAEHGSN